MQMKGINNRTCADDNFPLKPQEKIYSKLLHF